MFIWRCLAIIFIVTGFARAELTSTDQPPDDTSAQLTWPRTVKAAHETLTIYQPQVDKWIDDKIEIRAAVSVTRDEKSEPAYGVVWITARTDVDKANRLVTLDNIKIPRVAFPTDKAHEDVYQSILSGHVEDATRIVPLDHLESDLAASDAMKQAREVPVKNDPPKIIFSKKPALLISIDGEPVLRPVEGSDLMRVINTRALLVLSRQLNTYYLHVMGRWVCSQNVTGPWGAAVAIPGGIDAVKDKLVKSNSVDLLDPEDPDAAPEYVPDVYVSMTPTELIQTQGEPDYVPIAGTKLLYVRNTDSALFMHISTQMYYVLISGRWFSSKSLEGPWAFVPAKELPPDFAAIPADHPKANILVSIPGTDQAKEAIIADYIPQTATVSIDTTHLNVEYDGDPKFARIDGTQDLSYAVNTVLPVIRIDHSNTYWCVQNGIWFEAHNPKGKWEVAISVPTILYTIPVSSPLHYVTYVHVYGVHGDVVYVGYTPGYMGAYACSDGVVVYGTGYAYPAYVGDVWVGYPPTYGYGAGFACGTVTGLAFGFAAGAIIGGCWSHPYWGPCWGYSHVNINTASVYHNWRGGVTYSNRHYEFDSWSGKSSGSGRMASFNPYSGRSSVGGYSNYIDRGSGDFHGKAGGATYNPWTGVVSAGGVKVNGNMYDGDVNVKGAGGHYNTRTGNGAGYYNNDVYASHDGNVYRYDKKDGWQEHTDSGWQQPVKNDKSFSQQRQNLDQQRQSRSVGQQRFGNTRSSGSFHRVGSGGFRRR
jgi:hypothetical protein